MPSAVFNAFLIFISTSPLVLAQASLPSSTSATTSPRCTASAIAKLCDYPPPLEFALAEDSVSSCWDYCDAHFPCSFAIWNPGNPYTGTGTCWLYPDEQFNASVAKPASSCDNPYLTLYDKPICSRPPLPSTTSPGSSTDPSLSASSATLVSCPATATPSPLAQVCGYPPPDDCFRSCSASLSAADCSSQCAQRDACAYVVFVPASPSHSPYRDGTCWMYSNGTYDASLTKSCTGKAEQYVYKNTCPPPVRPASSSASLSSMMMSTATVAAGSKGSSATSSSQAANSGSRNVTQNAGALQSPSTNAGSTILIGSSLFILLSSLGWCVTLSNIV